MLRELIAWVLNNYLGKYVENLNTTQLTIALLSGEVELENLPLKKDALRHLGLPIQALSGSIGKIKLQVPVRQFRTASWCINIEKVFIVCGPVNLDEWDQSAEEQADLDYKQACLEDFEAKWRASKEDSGSYYASSYSGWMNYGTTLITNIVENLQLKIKDVHIRFEDTLTIPNNRFAYGLTIDSLTAQSCDANWVAGFTSNWAQSQSTFKIVELTSLSVYLDPLLEEETFSHLESNSLAEAIEKFKSKANHEFIIKPVSAQAKLKRDRSETPLRTRSRPRLTCDLIWNEISLSINEIQYNQIVNGMRGLDDIGRFKKYRLHRPLTPISHNPKLWWRYAAKCHGLQRHDQDLELAKNNLRYLSLCKRIIANPNEILSTEEKEFKEHVEKKRSLDELKNLREICMYLIPQADFKAAADNQGKSMLLHWFPQWMGWYSTSTSQSQQAPKQSIESFEDELLNALADSVESNSILKRDAVFGKFDFVLQKGTLDICSGATPKIQFQFENLVINVETRPRSASHFVKLALGSILLKDHLTPLTEFPDIIKPQVKDETVVAKKTQRSRLSLNILGSGSGVTSPPPQILQVEPLFQLEYERRPLSHNTDYRLLIKSRSLDIVYNMSVLRWLLDFISKPHQVGARRKIEAMKNKTRMEFKKNWENIIEGHLSERKAWTLEIDVWAPQIIFVENFEDKNSTSIVVIDFGRLQVTNGLKNENAEDLNNQSGKDQMTSDVSVKDSEDDEMFMTPCSTPPGSQVSTNDSPTLISAFSEIPPDISSSSITQNRSMEQEDQLNESALYNKLYDRYNINLTDMQILVCKGRERWNFASSKGTSTLHVLDRFNISLQVERRVVHTNDPQYPSLTLCGTLPKLNVHVNENKIGALVSMLNLIRSNKESPYRSPSEAATFETQEAEATVEEAQNEATKLILLQFAIDQMSLEVQSCGRSIAELQVTGVKAGYSQRPSDTSITLSVHGLLLVDAIQSYGPDFELLVASHRHVGMDSLSGSLRQSEPCSPCSPGSPDPSSNIRPTSPLSITRAIGALQRVNSPLWNATLDNDADALITIEVLLFEPINGGERLQVANIQFNNLDIIANQETIVELIGFAKRVIPKTTNRSSTQPKNVPQGKNTPDESKLRTEITFDFHRLNVLILRAIMRDNFMVARKVGTFTMSEARIHATVGKIIKVEGSLGGLQVLDLTPEGINHQRILSVGNDPLTDPPNEPIDLMTSLTQEVYGMKIGQHLIEDRQALSFKISRNLNACLDIKIRMASVWFIHCARFMQELNWCATEFKHYLKNLARSIREKAADMAFGLVQPRAGDIVGIADLSSSPRHARRNRTISLNRTTDNLLPNGPKVDIRLDIVLDTPVLVVPRSSSSPHVLVAHLGKISISNCKDKSTDLIDSSFAGVMTEDMLQYNMNVREFKSTENIFEMEDFEENIKIEPDEVYEEQLTDEEDQVEEYSIDIRNMNLYSLDTTSRKGFRLSALPRAEEFYSCNEDAIAILHDTAIRLEICRKLEPSNSNMNSSAASFISVSENIENGEQMDQLVVNGCIVNPLRLSLKRQQYEQLLETIDNMFKVPTDLVRPPVDTVAIYKYNPIDEHHEVELADPFTIEKNKIRKNLFYQGSVEKKSSEVHPKVNFNLPVLIIQLNNNANRSLIEISFRDFGVNYEKQNQYETNLQVSLRSVVMEDLMRPLDSKHRIMVSSASEEVELPRLKPLFVSHSCPDLIGKHKSVNFMSTSLPDDLEPNIGFHQFRKMQMPAGAFLNASGNNCPGTPPPSPQPRGREDNLVIYSSLLIDPNCPNFESKYKSLKSKSSIDFNCLNLNISVDSWFMVLNFFGLMNDDLENEAQAQKTQKVDQQQEQFDGKSELDISVRSLNFVLVKPEYELAKANVSNARFIVSKNSLTKTVEGSLGSISLSDLTVHGGIYREKFMTSGNEALSFQYNREQVKTFTKRSTKKDSNLNIKMSSVRYVHTKRFVIEIQTFFKDFLQLQMPVMRKIKPSERHLEQRPTQMGLEITAESPIILLPLSSRSEKIIVAHLGELTIHNDFKLATDPEVISSRKDRIGPIEMLDVMFVELLHTDLFAAYKCPKMDGDTESYPGVVCLDMGSYVLLKNGVSFLKDKCHLKLQIERNLDTWKSHNVPDISVHGTLSKLEAILDLQQYKLVRGFLSYNMGETIDDVYASSTANIYESSVSVNTNATNNESQVWINLSIKLDLQGVCVHLKQPRLDMIPKPQKFYESTPLACINFIKSTLAVDSYSDGSQDIDLVSQEILITDTRNLNNHHSTRNVFTNILKPMKSEHENGLVQAEIHSRKRLEKTKFTILLNNMRLMAILDWLESSRDFILQIEEPTKAAQTPAPSTLAKVGDSPNAPDAGTFELKLNITDSELVFVENTDQLDTNAVILKSTTVLSFKPNELSKVMSINLNNLEVFSCSLDAEEESALSIIDPVTVNMDIRKGVLVVHMQKQFFIRLSYHDVKMFQKMLQSLPQQTRTARSFSFKKGKSANKADKENLGKLQSLGFDMADCMLAMEIFDNHLDEAALWLTHNAEPSRNAHTSHTENPLDINAVEIKAARISICVIDDCKDADVPLLELALSNLELHQDLHSKDKSFSNLSSAGNFRVGNLKGTFASDYYNRALSGWEPIIEPWKCEADWSYSLGPVPSLQNRLNLKIRSKDILKLNITSTLMELYQIVRDNWTQDYNEDSKNSMKARRRAPFVPFAIKNDTGIKLWFTTMVTQPGAANNMLVKVGEEDKNWEYRSVEIGDTEIFSFRQVQTKQRHIDSHKLNSHQIKVRVEGWGEVGPISVDKVGVYFRHARAEMADEYSNVPRARIVFGVTLEGSAQKLIIVRSALRFNNRLDHPILMKMEHLFGHLNIRNWPQSKTVIVTSNENYSVPLSHVHSFLFVKPLPINFKINESLLEETSTSSGIGQMERIDGNSYWNRFGRSSDSGSITNFAFTEKSIHWKDVQELNEVHQELRTCCSMSNNIYNLMFSIRKEAYPSKDNSLLPGHSITLWPPMRLHNLLPCDLLYKLPSGTQGRVSSSNTGNIHEVDLEQTLEITVTLDGFPGAGQIFLQSGQIATLEIDVKLLDMHGRVLILKAFISSVRGSGMQISISAPYWLVNRTGLPLMFRQEGVSNEFAGQYSENEQGRLVSPLMFSFSDQDGSMALTIRLGKRFGTNLPWCQPFNLHKDILHRQLKSNSTNETFILGIEVRRGRGRYSQTSIVTFSPRFQLYNRSSYKLQFAQKCFATILTDQTAKATFIEAVPGCHLPFHWPRLDKDQELCVRLPEIEDCLWSSGIPIHETQSLYVNVRNVNGKMHFLRLEIILQGATYYMLFGAAEVLPPPIRIDNYSEVAIKFYQNNCKNQTKTIVKPHSSVSYVLDEILGSQSICVEAPGGDTSKCPLYGFDSSRLNYENFIYIAFSQTFEGVGSFTMDYDEFDVKSQQLVLGVREGRVYLMQKEPGDRAQLWRMNNEKQLEHEGSSPPSEPGKKSTRFVLDLEKPPQPMKLINLVVRPANNQHKSTQTWYFTEEGRLMCEHSNMCVQPAGGFFKLKNGSEAVLGMIVKSTKIMNSKGVPFEQAIERQKLRPGSGCLTVNFKMDGPIKTLQIKDIKFSSDQSLAVDPAWRHVSHIMPRQGSVNSQQDEEESQEGTKTPVKQIDEYHITLNLTKGVGLSLVSRRPCEELAFITFENISTEIINTAVIKSLDLSVSDVQIDNQLFETSCPIFLYTIKNSIDMQAAADERLPALQLNIKILCSPNKNAIIFEHLILSLRPMSVYLEERLLLRLADFFNMGWNAPDPAALPDESDYEAQRIVTKVLAANAKRYYFGDLAIVPSQIRLSVLTASKLTQHLSELKKSLGLTLIKFEDATINFEKFCDKHHFETMEVYLSAIKSHYKQELKWHAAAILGSVDFLGNPMGFANDLTEGVSSLINEGSVKMLMKNVTHGISNSTAKLTETLSDGLGRVILDEQYTETRQRILEVTASSGSSTGDHLVAGLKGFGFGLLGGMTSIVKHTYIGAQADGLPGFISGLGKGIVGTVTKPVIGVLDLASEAANAVRETSKSSSRILPDRKRLPRCVTGAPGGLLPVYSSLQSKGQQHLFLINKRDFNEKIMAYEPCLLESKDSKLRLLVSTESIWVFSRTEDTTTVIFSYNLSEIVSCEPVVVENRDNSHSKQKSQHYIELALSLPSKSLTPSAPEMVRRPRVRCQNEEIAQKATRHIIYAKSVYDEREMAMNSDSVIDPSDR